MGPGASGQARQRHAQDPAPPLRRQVAATVRDVVQECAEHGDTMLAPVRSEGRSFFRVFAHHTLFLEDAWTEDIERCEEQFDAFSERQKLQTTFHGGSPITPAALVCQRDRGANASCERERSHLSRLWPAGRMAPETGLDPDRKSVV